MQLTNYIGYNYDYIMLHYVVLFYILFYYNWL